MKKHAKKLSIVLTLVLILTSFSFMGAFAVDEDGMDAAGTEAVETAAPAEEDPVVEEPTEEEPVVEEPVVEEPAEEDPVVEEPAEEEPAEEEPVVEEPVEEEAVTDEDTEEGIPEDELVLKKAEPAETEAVPAANAKTYKITWMNGDKVIATDTVAAGTVPKYLTGGREKLTKKDRNYEYTATSWNPKPVAATKNATYKAVFTKTRSIQGTPAAPVVKTFSSFKSIALEWARVTKDKYGIPYTAEARKNVKYQVRYRKKGDTKWTSWQDVGTRIKFHTPKPYNLDPLKTYIFEVRAYIKPDVGRNRHTETTVSDSPVQPIRYKLYIKSGGTLTSHYKYNAARDSYSSSSAGKKVVKAGQYIYADRFATGRYMFTEGNYVFFVSRTRLGSKSCVYTQKWDYSTDEMQYFVNDKGRTSRTPYLIMVSQYTQHVYLFKGTKVGSVYKNWKYFTNPTLRNKNKYAYEKDYKAGAAMHWECGTGTASDPTPTSHDGLKTLCQNDSKHKVKHSIPWWSPFHGTAAFHGNKIRTNDKGLGKPVSSGCVRNPHERAHWIYDKCPVGTQVVIY